MEVLVFLSQDKDETIRNTAYYTLQAMNSQEFVLFLKDPSTPVAVLDFVSNHLAPGKRDLTQALLENPGLPPDLREWVETLQALPDSGSGLTAAPTPVGLEAPTEEQAPGEKRETLLQRIGRMSAAEKIKAALTGNQEERLALIRDSNKIVARAVLQSPKLSDMEIENIASMKSVTEEVLRLIATNRKFMKSYAVVRQLVNNPRTPIDVGLPLLNRLNERDLKGLTLNKNVAEVLRGMATKMMKQKEEAKKPKLTTGKH